MPMDAGRGDQVGYRCPSCGAPAGPAQVQCATCGTPIAALAGQPPPSPSPQPYGQFAAPAQKAYYAPAAPPYYAPPPPYYAPYGFAGPPPPLRAVDPDARRGTAQQILILVGGTLFIMIGLFFLAVGHLVHRFGGNDSGFALSAWIMIVGGAASLGVTWIDPRKVPFAEIIWAALTVGTLVSISMMSAHPIFFLLWAISGGPVGAAAILGWRERALRRRRTAAGQGPPPPHS
jgi:hypothetical protein